MLAHKGHYSQLMCWNATDKRIVSRELVYGEEEVIKWARKYNGKGNCFIGRNPRDKDGNVSLCTTLSLDIDPTREKDTAATDSQVEEAISAGKRVVEFFHYGIVCCSGNGSLVLFPLREPVSKEVAERWGKAIEEQAKQLVEGLNVTVDSTFDASRLAKLMGCISTKGDTALWRHARIVSRLSVGNAKEFYTWLGSVNASTQSNTSLPEISKGELDRSKADIALANRLKIQGFTAEDTYRALCAFATRPGRDDDYKRIIQKVFFNSGTITDLVSGGTDREIVLITPKSGLAEYRSRDRVGVPELPTGFKSIDAATFGLIRGSIFTVGARTNCGKTTFAMGTAFNLCRIGKRVLFLSTETT